MSSLVSTRIYPENNYETNNKLYIELTGHTYSAIIQSKSFIKVYRVTHKGCDFSVDMKKLDVVC